MTTQNKTLRIGSISEGTMRSKDLITAFMDALKSVHPELEAGLRESNPEIFEWLNNDCEGDEPENTSEFINEGLFYALNENCPAYAYFGSHEGDGARYGVWVDHDGLNEAVSDDEVFKCNDLSGVPEDWAGYVMLVNDHGNTSLYNREENGTMTEIWAVV